MPALSPPGRGGHSSLGASAHCVLFHYDVYFPLLHLITKDHQLLALSIIVAWYMEEPQILDGWMNE